MIKTYSELIKFDSFYDRFNYLKLKSSVGKETFGFDRYINQNFYRSREWKRTRDEIIGRDNGCDLGVDGFDIFSKIIIHHMNPITEDEILNNSSDLINPEFLICVSLNTHNAIHFGDENLLPKLPITRSPGDTTLWRKDERLNS